MKTLYLECKMGAAGDLLTAALYELLSDQEGFLKTMNSLIPGVEVRAERASTCGIVGTHMAVAVNGQQEESLDVPQGGHIHEHVHGHEHPHDHGHAHGHEHPHDHGHPHVHDHEHSHSHAHSHSSLADVTQIIDGLDLPQQVKEDAKAVYDRIAEAEAKAHGAPVSQIHFHEVGSLDAVADIVGVCLAVHLLAPDAVQASSIHVGSGQVRCAHGVVPVPAPATAEILKGIPCYGGEIQGELCTPTGAALLAHFAQKFGPMPPMTVENTGYGLGRKEFPAANCVRAFWGQAGDADQADIVELCCHIDDMTAEALAFAGERLMELGALDVSSAPITMKKGRLGAAFTVLCKAKDEERLAQAILRETTTNGVRSRYCKKYILSPSVRTVETEYGPMKVKEAQGFGLCRQKAEYEDAARVAREKNLPIAQVIAAVERELK